MSIQFIFNRTINHALVGLGISEGLLAQLGSLGLYHDQATSIRNVTPTKTLYLQTNHLNT